MLLYEELVLYLSRRCPITRQTEAFKGDMKRRPIIAEDRQRTPSVYMREQNVENLGNKGSIWGGRS